MPNKGIQKSSKTAPSFLNKGPIIRQVIAIHFERLAKGMEFQGCRWVLHTGNTFGRKERQGPEGIPFV
jgi:hypothetical protein